MRASLIECHIDCFFVFSKKCKNCGYGVPFLFLAKLYQTENRTEQKILMEAVKRCGSLDKKLKIVPLEF